MEREMSSAPAPDLDELVADWRRVLGLDDDNRIAPARESGTLSSGLDDDNRTTPEEATE
jgi:hypothetical protein